MIYRCIFTGYFGDTTENVWTVEEVVRRRSVKKLFLEISKNSQENSYVMLCGIYLPLVVCNFLMIVQ